MSGPNGVPPPHAPFQVHVHPDRERVVVAPVGEIDLSTAPEMRHQLRVLLDRGFTDVVLDLRGVEFLDSQGIRAMIAAHQRAIEVHARLSVVLGNDQTRRALEICGVLEHLNVRPPPSR